MKDARLTIRIPRALLEEAKRYAAEHHTSLTRLVCAHLRQLVDKRDALADAPIVRRLSGVLSQAVAVEDYKNYLAEKHGCSAQGVSESGEN
jgi:hypothetical protein